MDPKSFKCPYCVKVMPSLEGLRKHCRKHKVNAKKLYVDLFCDGVEPTCACGCNSAVKFLTIHEGFSTYQRGHSSRVNNNWGHNVAALEKSHATTKRLYDSGEIQAWNKGLTKESDDRVLQLGLKGSHTLKTDPICQKQRSEHMIEQWKTGQIVPQVGAAHGMWKGGTSALQPICRARLHAVWTYPKFKASGFRCSKCNKPGPELNVHHSAERFAPILAKAIAVIGEPGEDFERKSLIAEWVADYHVTNDIPGIVLCHDCHVLAHAELGEEIN